MLTDVSPETETGKRTLAGKCNCGGVRYQVEDAFVYASNCHCSNCRAATGSAFKPFAGIEREKLELIAGAEQLLIVGDDRLNDTRCRACGSLLFSVVRDGEYVHVAMGTCRRTNHATDEAHLRRLQGAVVRSHRRPPQFEEHASQLSPEDAVARSLRNVSAISLFVNDLQAAKSFYETVFGVEVVFEDDSSVCVRFGRLFVNLLHVSVAKDQVEPGGVAGRESGSRFQLSIWVDDVDAVYALLKKRGVTPPTGRPTASGACAPPPSPIRMATAGRSHRSYRNRGRIAGRNRHSPPPERHE